MKVTNEKTENNETYLTVEMDSAEVEESSANVYRRLVKQVNIPGFRKGKAPRPILERFVGQERLVNDMLEDLVPRAYEKAIEEQQLEAIAQPKIEVIETDPVKFQAVVPLKPVVNLGDYHQIQVTEEPVEVTEETVDRVIEDLRHQYATWEPVERAAQMDDLLNLDVESTIDGEPYINQKGARYRLIADSQTPAPGFAEQLVGMNKGDEKEFNLQFPEDYSQSELVGKEVVFKVSVSEIKEENLPEVTDEFAAQVEAEIGGVEELRNRIRSDLQSRAEDRTRMDFEQRAIEAVVEVSEVEFPPVLVETEIHRLMEDQARTLQMQGLSFEQYLRSAGKTEEELHEELHPTAKKRVAESLALMKLSEEENILVEEADIDAEISRVTEDTAEDRKEQLHKMLNTPQMRESIKTTLLTRKTVEKLVEIVRDSGETEASQKEEK
ncbi:MAG: trigger factor [Dehalococcoidales bacterium]|nr:trigger factor [Dehalococcoidales bacterium]